MMIRITFNIQLRVVKGNARQIQALTKRYVIWNSKFILTFKTT